MLPLGLIQGQKITQVLRNATMRVADVQDFDMLPTPFRGLATDLETGDPVILRSGDLATVLRASMSAPGVFAPVEIDGRNCSWTAASWITCPWTSPEGWAWM